MGTNLHNLNDTMDSTYCCNMFGETHRQKVYENIKQLSHIEIMNEIIICKNQNRHKWLNNNRQNGTDKNF